MEPNYQRVVIITDEDREDLKKQYTLIEQHAYMLKLLQRELGAFVQRRYGIDIQDAEVDWELDIERGVFTLKTEIE